MKTFITEFHERQEDVCEYLKLLIFFDSLATNKRKTIEGESYNGKIISFLPNRECQKILRANLYLLLYNLVESTINTIIIVVKDAINDENVSLDKLETRLINLHIAGVYKDVTSTNKILERSKDLYRKATNKESVFIEKFGFNTSGNVDYDYFQKIVGAIGCRSRVNLDEEKVKVAMIRTKDHRNRLAHGNCSFSSAGSMLTLQQIREDYDCIVDFLKQSLDNLEIFLNSKKYLKGKGLCPKLSTKLSSGNNRN